MTADDLKKRLGAVADRLVPVSGTLMHFACQDDFIHEPGCDCRTCQAFVASQECTTELERIIRELDTLNG